MQHAAQPLSPSLASEGVSATAGQDAAGAIIVAAIRQAGGWLPFDAFVALALYAPGVGYYSARADQIGLLPGAQGSGSDFATAPEISPLFGRTLAVQVAEALERTGTSEIWEFGAGSGALAFHLLQELDRLGVAWSGYRIVDLSGALQARQRSALAPFGDRVQWRSDWPDVLQGVVIGNELLDAMPVKLLARVGGLWHERGVVNAAQADATAGPPPVLAWADRPTALRPPLDVPGDHDYLTEIHPQAEAWVRSLAQRLQRGAVLLLDYGFPEHEYYHPQRHMGTLMCHQAHRADTDPLTAVGRKDITAHVNFSSIALAAQDAGLDVLGYTTQARFLLNCGLLDRLQHATQAERIMAQRLMAEHEMGELFKVLALCKHPAGPWDARGFVAGDRMHTL
jgi:SAM-dependent MidA family methyltransferase